MPGAKEKKVEKVKIDDESTIQVDSKTGRVEITTRFENGTPILFVEGSCIFHRGRIWGHVVRFPTSGWKICEIPGEDYSFRYPRTEFSPPYNGMGTVVLEPSEGMVFQTKEVFSLARKEETPDCVRIIEPDMSYMAGGGLLGGPRRKTSL